MDPVTTNSTYWDWQIVMPYSSTTFTLPALATGIDQFNLIATDTADVRELITAKVPGGYDAVRAEILSSTGPETFAAGATGRIVFETLENLAVGEPRAPRAARRRGRSGAPPGSHADVQHLLWRRSDRGAFTLDAAWG